MTTIRVGVQAPATSSGQIIDIDAQLATITSVVNQSGTAISYSADSAATWTQLAAGATVAMNASVQPGAFRLRVTGGGSYPLPVDVTFTEFNGLTPAQAAAVAAGAMYAPSGQTMVCIGDSLQANGFTLNAVPKINQVSAVTWGCALLKQAIWVPFGSTSAYVSGPSEVINYNLSVGGVSLDDVISTQIGPAALLTAGWWSVQCGTNDVALVPTASVETICGKLRTIVEAGLAAGVRVALWTLPPRNDSSGTGNWQSYAATIISGGSTVAAQRLKQHAVNQWIRRYAQETNGVVLIDPYSELVDPSSATGDWKAGLATDGLHWNSAGGFVAGQVFANAMRQFVKPAQIFSNALVDAFNATNNVSGNAANAFTMQGTGGTVGGTGVSGNPPTGWDVNINSGTLNPGTAVVTTQARTDVLSGATLANGRECKVVIGGAPPGAFTLREYQAPSTIIPAGLPFVVDVAIAMTASPAATPGPSVLGFFNAGTVESYCAGMETDGVALPAGSTFDIVIRCPIMRSTGTSSGWVFTLLNGIAGSQATLITRGISIRPLEPAMPGLVLGTA